MESVANWKVAADNFNVLQKKFMFIPMHVKKNKDMHWALAVVVNASHIQNGVDYVKTCHG